LLKIIASASESRDSSGNNATLSLNLTSSRERASKKDQPSKYRVHSCKR